jgi:hypothetical protein
MKENEKEHKIYEKKIFDHSMLDYDRGIYYFLNEEK